MTVQTDGELALLGVGVSERQIVDTDKGGFFKR